MAPALAERQETRNGLVDGATVVTASTVAGAGTFAARTHVAKNGINFGDITQAAKDATAKAGEIASNVKEGAKDLASKSVDAAKGAIGKNTPVPDMLAFPGTIQMQLPNNAGVLLRNVNDIVTIDVPATTITDAGDNIAPKAMEAIKDNAKSFGDKAKSAAGACKSFITEKGGKVIENFQGLSGRDKAVVCTLAALATVGTGIAVKNGLDSKDVNPQTDKVAYTSQGVARSQTSQLEV